MKKLLIIPVLFSALVSFLQATPLDYGGSTESKNDSVEKKKYQCGLIAELGYQYSNYLDGFNILPSINIGLNKHSISTGVFFGKKIIAHAEHNYLENKTDLILTKPYKNPIALNGYTIIYTYEAPFRKSEMLNKLSLLSGIEVVYLYSKKSPNGPLPRYTYYKYCWGTDVLAGIKLKIIRGIYAKCLGGFGFTRYKLNIVYEYSVVGFPQKNSHKDKFNYKNGLLKFSLSSKLF